jgi:hypothetical protein
MHATGAGDDRLVGAKIAGLTPQGHALLKRMTTR